jgi:hypothetical protein
MGAPPGGYQQAGAAQKTMIAGMAPPNIAMPPPGAPGGAPPPAAPSPGPGGYVAAGAAQKTMMAQSPFAAGGPMAGVGAGGAGGPPPPMGMGGPPPGMAPGLGMPPGGGPQHGMPPPGMGGPPPGMGGPPPGMGMGGPAPQKTMMLQDSEGIVSVAHRGGGAVPLVGTEPTGASATFWVVSILVGVAVGALGYIVVLQL